MTENGSRRFFFGVNHHDLLCCGHDSPVFVTPCATDPSPDQRLCQGWPHPILASHPGNGHRPIKSNDPPHVIETFCAVTGYFTSLQLSFADICPHWDICWWALHGIFECNRKDNPSSQVGGGIRWNMPVSRKNNILSKWNKRIRITHGKYLHSLNLTILTSCYCLLDSRIFNRDHVRIEYKSNDFLGRLLLEAWD